MEMISNGNINIEIKVFEMKILNYKNSSRKYNLKDDTMNESQLQKYYN